MTKFDASIIITILIISLIIISLFITGCIEFEREYITVRPKPKSITNITEIVTNNVTNVTNNVTITEEEVKCEELTEDEKEKCIIERALENEDVSECYSLENQSFIKCIYSISKLNFNYCYKLNNTIEIDLCIFNVSIENKNEEICGKILNATLKKKCLISFVSEKCKNKTNDLEIYTCDAIEKEDENRCNLTENRSTCLIRFSKEKKNVCNKIEGYMDRVSCIAVVNNNDNECLVLNGSQRDYCYKIFAIERESCKSCDKINSVVHSNPCYYECAIITLNSFYCSKPTEEILRDNCYKDIAVLTKNHSYCDEIKLKRLKAECQIKVAENLLDMTICDYVDILYRRECYIRMIGLPIPLENCLKINELYPERDTCLLNAARREKNTSICNYVSDQMREYCREITR